MSDGPIAKLLISSQSFSLAMKGLIENGNFFKENFTRQNLSEHLGKKSSGYLSDIISGRRKLPNDSVRIVSEYFSMDKNEKEYFCLLANLERSNNEEERTEILKQIEFLKRLMGKSMVGLSQKLKDSIFALEVFGGWSLFSGKPTYDDLLQFYGRDRILDLERALRFLIAEKFIVKNGVYFEFADQEGRAINGAPELSDKETIHTFLRHSFKDSAKAVSKYYNKPEEAIFISRVLSCKKEEYLEKIGEFRRRIFNAHYNLESGDGDMLVRLNIALQPLGEKS